MEGVFKMGGEGVVSIISILTMVLIGEIQGYTQHKILWTTDDILFTQPLQPTVRATMGDAADFLCPRIGPLQDVFSNDVKENILMSDFLIYHVTEEDYKNCSLTSRDDILKCDRPTDPKMFTIDIVQYNAIPGSIEFKCGKQYYFIAKEKGPSRVSTMCRKYNSRLRMNITCAPYQELPVFNIPSERSTPRALMTQLLLKTVATPADDKRNLYILVGAGASFIFITSIIIITLIVIMLFRSKKEREEQQKKDKLKETITVVRNAQPLPPTPQHHYDTPHYYTIENPQDDSNSSGIYSYISE